MKISENNQVAYLNSYVQNASASEKKNDQEKKIAKQDPLGEEKVELSARARDIQKIKNILEDVPDVRKEKVTELKQSIDNGTYNVSGEMAAKKMLEESLLDEIL